MENERKNSIVRLKKDVVRLKAGTEFRLSELKAIGDFLIFEQVGEEFNLFVPCKLVAEIFG